MLFPDYPRLALYTPEFYERVRDQNPFERHLSLYRAHPHLHPSARMQYVDTQTYLADDILVKVDKTSMLNSIETRAPLLDHMLAEYVTALPASMRMRKGKQKHLLKRIAAEMLPSEVLNRPKQGFSIPLSHWFRHDTNSYAHDVLGSQRARQRGIFQPDFLQTLLQTDGSVQLANHSQALWTLLCLELWFQTYMDQPPQEGCETEIIRSTQSVLKR